MARVLNHRIPRRNSYDLVGLVKAAQEEISEARTRLYELESLTRLAKLALGVALTRLETMRQVLARPVTRPVAMRRPTP